MRIVTVGDLLLDVVVRLEQPLARSADATSQTTLSAGGQAANVAAWVSALGGQGRFLGKRAADGAGRLALDDVSRHGVEVVGPVAATGTGVVVSLVSPDGDRTMCSDRGIAPELTPDELDPGWLSDCAYVHISGYALALEPIRFAAIEAVVLARERGARVSVDLSSWSVIRDVGPDRFREP